MNYFYQLKYLLALKYIRFILVGGLNTMVGYSVFAVLLFLGLPANLALFGATCFGIIFNFKTISSLVFSTHNNQLFYRFLLLYTFLYLGNLGLLYLLDNWLHNSYFSGIISILLMTTPSYFGNKLLFTIRRPLEI